MAQKELEIEDIHEQIDLFWVLILSFIFHCTLVLITDLIVLNYLFQSTSLESDRDIFMFFFENVMPNQRLISVLF